PRGESISCPSTWYVGQAGRQKPQWTHAVTASLIAVPCSPSASIGIVCCMRECSGVLRSDGGGKSPSGIERLLHAPGERLDGCRPRTEPRRRRAERRSGHDEAGQSVEVE